MNEEIKKVMREILLERYGVDVNEAKFHYSTQNYAFICVGELLGTVIIIDNAAASVQQEGLISHKLSLLFRNLREAGGWVLPPCGSLG